MNDFMVSFNLFGEFDNFEDWDAAEEEEKRKEYENKEMRHKEVTPEELNNLEEDKDEVCHLLVSHLLILIFFSLLFFCCIPVFKIIKFTKQAEGNHEIVHFVSCELGDVKSFRCHSYQLLLDPAQ